MTKVARLESTTRDTLTTKSANRPKQTEAETTTAKLLEQFKLDETVKSAALVTPAKAWGQNLLKALDSGLRRNDEKSVFQLFSSPAILER